MATRQYVGARYVPKFYDYNGSSNWRSGTEYEALTIVTLNGNSYTSKIPVPSSVGSPDQNPDYWVATGLYNQQVEAYRQLTLAVADRVTDVEGDVTTLEGTVESQGTRLTTAEGDIDNLETATSGLDTRLTTAEGDIDAIEQSFVKRYVFVGDSYGVATVNWIDSVITKMGLTIDDNAFKVAAPSTGFIGDLGAGGDKTWKTLLTNADISDPTTITDIVVCGGTNDMASFTTKSALDSAISEFCSYAHGRFPNALIHIGMIGHSKESALILNTMKVTQCYRNTPDYAVYIDNAEYLWKFSADFNDNRHPTDDTMLKISSGIYNYLKNGSTQGGCSSGYVPGGITISQNGILSGGTVQDISFNSGYDNELTFGNISCVINFSTAKNISCYDGPQILFDLYNTYAIHTGYMNFPCAFRLYSASENRYYVIPGYFSITNGQIQASFNTKGDSGTTDKTIDCTQFKVLPCSFYCPTLNC